MVVATHVHWDHIGGHKYFDCLAVHEDEKEWLMGKFPLSLSIIKGNLLDDNCEFPSDFEAENYEIFQGIPQQILHDNDEIDLGKRKVKVLHTPGHSPGHHILDVPVQIISDIKKAFSSLEKTGNLKQGKGMFEFGDFQIHL